MQDDQVDQSRLLETMQSDKVAASRAVTQNRELKKQLEELQSGFVAMVRIGFCFTSKIFLVIKQNFSLRT